MSDSLRDQLLKAGFSQSAPEKKNSRKPHNKKRHKKKPAQASATAPAAAQESAADKPVPAANANKPPQSKRYRPASHSANHNQYIQPASAKKKKVPKPPPVKARAGSWSTRTQEESTQRAPKDPVAAEKWRHMKAEVTALIDQNAIKAFAGTEIYRFTLQNKIRELSVTAEIRDRIAGGELAITRLNGQTRLIPAAVADSIRTINPQWLLVLASDSVGAGNDDDEFPVPDDLMW